MSRHILRILRCTTSQPEPVDDFRDVLEDLWLNREARKAAEARNRLQFDMESDQ